MADNTTELPNTPNRSAVMQEGYERYCNLVTEREGINADLAEVMGDLSDATSISTKDLRAEFAAARKLSKMTPEQRESFEDARQSIRDALGDFIGTPLGAAAETREGA